MTTLVHTLGLVILGGLVATAPLAALAQVSENATAEATERLVNRVYYEGLSFEAAEALPPEATAHLAEILEDPAFAPHHSNAILALGISGHPGSYEALIAYPLVLEGEVSRQTYRSFVTLQTAMGHLGRQDERAVTWLVERLVDPNPDPPFSFRALRGPRLARELLARATAAASLTGSARARNVLIGLRDNPHARSRSGVSLSPASLDSALEQLDRIRADGPERALASPFSRAGRTAGPR